MGRLEIVIRLTTQSVQSEIMRLVYLSLLLVVTCSSLKISPFVPEEISALELDLAKTEYQKYKVAAVQRGDQPDTGAVRDETTSPGPPPDNSDDTVPIVVGCVLAGLIAVVMVSYFVLRARAK